MKTKKKITTVLTLLILFSAKAQYFQKAFEVNEPNQQEMYSLSIGNNNIYTAGTSRNINYFEDFNFRGALSKLGPNANLLRSKVYFPTDAVPMHGIFINSVIHSDGNAIYAFATHFGLPEVSG
jgi:hypothetical protein